MRFAAFLRAINLGRRRVSGLALADVFSSLGHDNVATFLASGNVVFDAPAGDIDRLTTDIESALSDALGYRVPTFLRDADAVRSIAAAEPFPPTAVEASHGKLQVVMLRAAPTRERCAEVAAISTDEDRLVIVGAEMFWLPSGGTQTSALDWKRLDRIIGLSTMRTKNTVDRIAKRFLSDSPWRIRLHPAARRAPAAKRANRADRSR